MSNPKITVAHKTRFDSLMSDLRAVAEQIRTAWREAPDATALEIMRERRKAILAEIESMKAELGFSGMNTHDFGERLRFGTPSIPELA